MTRQPATHCRIGACHTKESGYFGWVQKTQRVRGETINGEVYSAGQESHATISAAIAWARQEAARRGLTIVGKYAEAAK